MILSFLQTRRSESHHLLGDHDDSLDREPPVAVVKEILETRAEEINDKDVVQTLLTKVVDVGNSRTPDQDLIGPIFVAKLRGIALPWFLFPLISPTATIIRVRPTHKFNSNLLIVQEVRSLKDHTKRTLSNFLSHSVVDTHHIRR